VKSNSIRILMLSFLILGFCAEGMAMSAYGDDLDGPPSGARKEKIRKRIETMKMWKLTQALDLDEKLASRLFPLLHEYDRKREGVEREIRKDIASLKAVIETHDESGMKEIIASLEKKHDALQRLGDEERSSLREILTVEQQAKYLIFKMEFKREIRKMIAESRRKRRERSGMEGRDLP
jgi:hypothetical protein